jgi:hypothetical protein
MTDPVHSDERAALAEITGLSEDERQAAMARLFNGTAIGALRARCYERLIEHWRTDALPTNATFIFYELEMAGVVTKDRGINAQTGEKYRRTHRQERGPADQIEANTRRYIEEHAAIRFTLNQWERIALTAEQVQADDAAGERLRGLALTKLDKRYKPAKSYEAVECEALGQAEIVRLIRQALDQLRRDLGLEPIEAVRVREEAERADARRLLRTLR